MRILLFFILGLLSAFYLSEIIALVGKKLHLTKILPIHHSFLGIAVFFLGLLCLIFGKNYLLGDPLHILAGTFTLGAGLGIILHHLMSEGFLISEKIEQKFWSKYDPQTERLLEIFPGALTWLALTSPLWLSLTLPFAVAYIILLADIYWLFNACKIAVLIYLGYRKMENAKKQNWIEKLDKDYKEEWKNYYHLLVIPTYKEPLEVLKPAFDSIINSNYPSEKIFLGIGLEERDSPEKTQEVIDYGKKYSDKIGGILVTIHPYGLPGEIPGPATNRNFVITNAVKEFNKRHIKPEQVIVTTLDADFVIHPQFLAGAMHKYLSTPEKERLHRSYTGCFLYNNNYWQASAPMRLIASGTAYWQLSEMVGSDKYINFSSLSMNMQSLLDIGLWIPDKVNDDSGFFWKAYFHFKGDYKVIPHFMPISADTVADETAWKAFQNQYLQLKRWAYGVEHMPFIIKQYFKAKDIDFWDRTDKLLFITWSYMKWGTLAFFITFAGYAIPFINKEYTSSVVAYNLPVISSWILTGAFIGLFSTIYAHEKTVPPRPKEWNFFQKAWSFLQWALIPLVLVTIASIPAIDAQTRLMLGKYMGFRVTNKVRT